MERPIVELLAQLQAHPILRCLTLDGITTFVRLITHLKRVILLPQPVNEGNPTNAPTVLLKVGFFILGFFIYYYTNEYLIVQYTSTPNPS